MTDDAGSAAGPGAGGAAGAGAERAAESGVDSKAGSGADLARAALARAREDARQRAAQSGTSQERVGGARTGMRRGARTRRFPGDAGRLDDPLPFAAALNHLLEERGWQDRLAATTALDGWDGLVGTEIAAHCRPVSLCDGVLTVSADSTAWATQLRLLARQLLARLRRELGDAALSRIVVRGPVAPDWKHGALRVRDGRGPRDTYG